METLAACLLSLLFSLAVVFLYIKPMTEENHEKRKKEAIEEIQGKIDLACQQQSSIFLQVAGRVHEDDHGTDEAQNALSFSNPLVQLCTGKWPPIALEGNPTELMKVLVNLACELDPACVKAEK